MNIQDAKNTTTLQSERTSKMERLAQKAVAFYKNGAPMDVIEKVTGLKGKDLDNILSEVELTPDELRVRDELAMAYLSNTTSRIQKRREEISKEKSRILEAISGKASNLLTSGVSKLLNFVEDVELFDMKDAEKLIHVLEKVNGLTDKLHEGLIRADQNILSDIVESIRIEQTDTTRQMILDDTDEDGRVLLDGDGRRKKTRVVEEESVQRVVGVNVKPL